MVTGSRAVKSLSKVFTTLNIISGNNSWYSSEFMEEVSFVCRILADSFDTLLACTS